MLRTLGGMKLKSAYRLAAIVIIVLINIGCDQLSKNYVRKNMDYEQSIGLLHNHFTLTKIENSGAFLSVGDQMPTRAKNILLTLFPLAAIVYGFFFVLTRTGLSSPQLTGICFIMGGGIGNIFDRIRYGSVTDFMHIDFGLFQTGIFNLADVSITTGALLIVFNAVGRSYKKT